MKRLALLAFVITAAFAQITPFPAPTGGTGSGATIPAVTNVICGSGTGNGADCGYSINALAKPNPPGYIPAAIYVTPSTGLQAITNASPPNSIFIIQGGFGTYHDCNVMPLSGDQYIGLNGPVMKCSKVLTGATLDGNGNYVYTGQTQTENTPSLSGACISGTTCLESNDLFFDGVYQTRDPDVTSSPTGLVSGHWTWDKTHSIIYIHQNPASHTVETDSGNGLETVFTSNGGSTAPSFVTLRGLTISQVGSSFQQGCIITGPGWVLDKMSVSSCHGVGVGVGPGANGVSITNSTIFANGVIGITAYLAAALKIDSNEFYGNQVVGASCGFSCGTFKGTGTQGVQFTNNYVHNENGNGPWMDSSNIRYAISYNIILNCLTDGIRLENSSGGTVENNLSQGNGTTITGGYAQLNIVDSSNILVRQNRFITGGYATGIAVGTDTHPLGGFSIAYTSVNETIIENDITTLAGCVQFYCRAVSVISADQLPYYSSRGVANATQAFFDYNQYHLVSAVDHAFLVSVFSDDTYNGWIRNNFGAHDTMDLNNGGTTFPISSFTVTNNKIRAPYIVPMAADTLVNLDYGVPWLYPTSPITQVHITNWHNNLPATIHVCNGSTVYQVLFDYSVKGIGDNTTTAANSCSTYQIDIDPTASYYIATNVINATNTYVAADNFTNIGGYNVPTSTIKLPTTATWSTGFSTGSASYQFNGANGAIIPANSSSLFVTTTLPTTYTVRSDITITGTPASYEAFGVMARAGTISNQSTGYSAEYAAAGGPVGAGFYILIQGSRIVGTGVAYTAVADTYRMILQSNPNAGTPTNVDLKLYIQRLSDSLVLNSSGTWATAYVPAITVTNDNSGFSAAGSAGIFGVPGTSQPIWSNFGVTTN